MAALAVAATAAPARAAQPPAGALSDEGTRLEWSGSVGDSLGAGDSFALQVDLPPETWASPGGVQVGIKWQYDSDERADLDLVVIGPSGTVVSTSAGLDEDSETVLLPRALSGPYRVEARNKFGGGISYRGWAEVERPPAAAPLRDLLPNLVAMPQREIGFPSGVGAGSCTATEQDEDGAGRCLRLEQAIANVGDGPMEIRYGFGPSDGGLQPLSQVIRRSDGTFYERVGDQWEYHGAHGHFHYKNFAMSRLWAATPAGEVQGSEPLRSGRKNGFCLLDVENIWWQRKGDAPKTHNGCEPTIQGIGVGWADVYNYYLDGQYVEVSGIPDGDYMLETIADPPSPEQPFGTILESDETDNAVWVRIRIAGDEVAVLDPPLPALLAPDTSTGPPPAASAPAPAARPRPLVLRVSPRRLRVRRAPTRPLVLHLRPDRSLREVRATLTPRARGSRPTARGRLARVGRSATLRLRLRRPLRRGAYRLRVEAVDAGGNPVRATVTLIAR